MRAPKTERTGKLRKSPSATNPGRWPVAPYEQRAIEALLDGPKMRHDLDAIVGCENSPDVIMRACRELGFSIACERVRMLNRDRRPCYPGRYYLTPEQRDRALALRREAQEAPKLRQATISQPAHGKPVSGPQGKRTGVQ
ncbi:MULTISPECIES: hypothetical protein [unclassified Variovorax]|uniref:hypothetical protein n=1 Tax=unclassified Variovorax TaxID=663243 RepID=UPI00076C7D48|nr:MULTISPECIES: hypothetical protein [unclassified Variovorax]KWT83709.1 hypothetical protein APY03_4264 [Variovorax sp. WDL1]PNG46387.1 hypothetical protein CHC06_06728 [Variovorax sp. B2]PNG47791.1 hypothetical protein CHC07_06959 [Variovorax sp. B4]VTV14122.1 hypothetical protein WDL1CHR_04701 [Variovorax sp. WDL1]